MRLVKRAKGLADTQRSFDRYIYGRAGRVLFTACSSGGGVDNGRGNDGVRDNWGGTHPSCPSSTQSARHPLWLREPCMVLTVQDTGTATITGSEEATGQVCACDDTSGLPLMNTTMFSQ